MNFKEVYKALGVAFATLLLAFGLLAFLASQAEGKDRVSPQDGKGVLSLDWKQATVIPIVGEVGPSIIGQAGYIEDLIRTPDAPKTIKILINSPGGSVIAGNIFIQAMEVAKQRGFRIECAVSNMAASMAMHILAHCDDRYALTGALLLFHEARVTIQGTLTERELRRMAQSMGALTYNLEDYLLDALGCSPKFYREHNEGETFWSAEKFQQTFEKFDLQIVYDIKVNLPTEGNTIFNPIGNKTDPKKKETSPSKEDVGSPVTIPWRIIK